MPQPPLEATLDADVDDAVAFSFVVRNAGETPVELSFRSGQSIDVVVLADGEPVWRWSDGRLFTQALRQESLAPGAAATYEAGWDAPRPGCYEAVATLEAEGVDVEARTRFTT